MSLLIEALEEMVRWQNERSCRQGLIDDAKKAVTMEVCPIDLERHLLLNCGRFDRHPKVWPEMKQSMEQMRPTSARWRLAR